jgi:hypothetical protein
MSQCTSCAAPILWALTVNDEFMPVDAEPSEDGNVELVEEGRIRRAIVHAALVGSSSIAQGSLGQLPKRWRAPEMRRSSSLRRTTPLKRRTALRARRRAVPTAQGKEGSQATQWRRCHEWVDSNPRSAAQMGLLKHSWEDG